MCIGLAAALPLGVNWASAPHLVRAEEGQLRRGPMGDEGGGGRSTELGDLRRAARSL